MGRTLHCTDCERSTNHTKANHFSEASITIYQCHKCSRYRTLDETDNDWLTLLSEFYQKGFNNGKKSALKTLDIGSEDYRYWQVTEDMDEDEAIEKAEEKENIGNMP